jgi:glycosyltransferase involved in cell wall biosynthesis
MNMGAEVASGDILLFMHADIKFPDRFEQNVEASILSGNDAGCFCYWFDSPRRLLRVNAYFTKLKGLICRGGDQTLFIKRSFFRQLGGFNPAFCVMEDFELIQRIQIKGTFVVRPERILVSARKYRKNGWLRVQWANLVAFIMFRLHVEPAKIQRRYKGLLSVN